MKGIKFLYETCFESVAAMKSENFKGSGGILAHCKSHENTELFIFRGQSKGGFQNFIT